MDPQNVEQDPVYEFKRRLGQILVFVAVCGTLGGFLIGLGVGMWLS